MSTQVTEAVDRATAQLGGAPDADGAAVQVRKPLKEMPRQIRKAIALRAMGLNTDDIADRMGIKKRSLWSLFYRARRDYGWDDMGDQLAQVALPQAVDNIVAHLRHEGTEDAIKQGQSLMTRTFAAGVGVLKSHSAVKSVSKSENLNIMRIEIVGLHPLPEGAQDAGPVPGVLATPRRAPLAGERAALPPATHIEGEVVK